MDQQQDDASQYHNFPNDWSDWASQDPFSQTVVGDFDYSRWEMDQLELANPVPVGLGYGQVDFESQLGHEQERHSQIRGVESADAYMAGAGESQVVLGGRMDEFGDQQLNLSQRGHTNIPPVPHFSMANDQSVITETHRLLEEFYLPTTAARTSGGVGESDSLLGTQAENTLPVVSNLQDVQDNRRDDGLEPSQNCNSGDVVGERDSFRLQEITDQSTAFIEEQYEQMAAVSTQTGELTEKSYTTATQVGIGTVAHEQCAPVLQVEEDTITAVNLTQSDSPANMVPSKGLELLQLGTPKQDIVTELAEPLQDSQPPKNTSAPHVGDRSAYELAEAYYQGKGDDPIEARLKLNKKFKPLGDIMSSPKNKVISLKQADTFRNRVPAIPTLPSIARTTVQVFYGFLYLLSQRDWHDWDPMFMKDKMAFFMRVQARIEYPSRIRHLTTTKVFLEKLEGVMLEIAEQHWKEHYTQPFEEPTDYDDRDKNFLNFPDAMIDYKDWTKCEEAEVKAFTKLVLEKNEWDVKHDEEAVEADPDYVIPETSGRCRYFMSRVTQPEKLLGLIKKHQREVDDLIEQAELAERAGLTAQERHTLAVNEEYLTVEDFIQKHSFAMPVDKETRVAIRKAAAEAKEAQAAESGFESENESESDAEENFAASTSQPGQITREGMEKRTSDNTMSKPKSTSNTKQEKNKPSGRIDSTSRISLAENMVASSSHKHTQSGDVKKQMQKHQVFKKDKNRYKVAKLKANIVDMNEPKRTARASKQNAQEKTSMMLQEFIEEDEEVVELEVEEARPTTGGKHLINYGNHYLPENPVPQNNCFVAENSSGGSDVYQTCDEGIQQRDEDNVYAYYHQESHDENTGNWLQDDYPAFPGQALGSDYGYSEAHNESISENNVDESSGYQQQSRYIDDDETFCPFGGIVNSDQHYEHYSLADYNSPALVHENNRQYAPLAAYDGEYISYPYQLEPQANTTSYMNNSNYNGSDFTNGTNSWYDYPSSSHQLPTPPSLFLNQSPHSLQPSAAVTALIPRRKLILTFSGENVRRITSRVPKVSTTKNLPMYTYPDHCEYHAPNLQGDNKSREAASSGNQRGSRKRKTRDDPEDDFEFDPAAEAVIEDDFEDPDDDDFEFETRKKSHKKKRRVESFKGKGRANRNSIRKGGQGRSYGRGTR